MKFTLGWLKDYLETDSSLDEIVAKLTDLGLEVDGVHDPAAAFAPFAVAYVEAAEKHPDADRLKVCTVDTGIEKIQVVCGAPNARTGMKGIFAPAGSYVPGTDMVLKKGVIRGQESNGMLVSEREMGLSDEHDGIIEVADDVAIGTKFAALYGMDDPVIEIGLTPNRPDCAGIYGIARDLAAAGLGTLKHPEIPVVKGAFKSDISVSLVFEEGDKEACPYFVGCLIKGIKNGPAPKWMQNRMKAVGLKSISTIVDITNYLSYALCRPLHVFDADKLSGGLHARLAKEGETILALDEEEYTLSSDMTVIADDKKAHAIAGVMGGMESGCGLETTNVFLEVGYFDPMRTAKTGRALQIISDARYRFERGVDPAFLEDACAIATQMIVDLCGGKPSEPVIAGAQPAPSKPYEFDPALTVRMSGVGIPEDKQLAILKDLGFVIEGKKAPYQVSAPTWRPDILGKADLVEEIIRVYGYEHIPALSVRRAAGDPKIAETPSLRSARKARAILADLGLHECVTWSFMGGAQADLFGAQNAAALTLKNPISSALDRMRPSILPNLIEAAGRNYAKSYPDNALFEVGPVFHGTKPQDQEMVATAIRAGHMGPRHWSGENANRAVDLYDAKDDALAVLAACGAPASNMQVSRDAPQWYHPGRSGALRLGPKVFAYFGELHPAVLSALNVRERMCAAEVFLDRIPAPRNKGTEKAFLALNPLQPLSRDFAFMVGRDVAAADLVRAAMGADKKMITAAEIFDVYQGDNVAADQKSVALNVSIQPQEKSMTDEEIEALSKKIINSIETKTGAKLRGV
jgi:phenylalanyl-tRNA synthetase beta chain